MKSDSSGDVFSDTSTTAFTNAARAAHERRRMDREIEELAAELEAKAAREAKRNRPIKVKTFEC